MLNRDRDGDRNDIPTAICLSSLQEWTVSDFIVLNTITFLGADFVAFHVLGL